MRSGCVARDLPEPSPLAHEILNARPYAFLDDAPLEERRTQAVYTRRAFEPSSADDLGALDPAAIERVRDEAWPEVRERRRAARRAAHLGLPDRGRGNFRARRAVLGGVLPRAGCSRAGPTASTLGSGSALWAGDGKAA